MPVAKDGTVPFARWVIRRRGEIELGSMGCNTCHTRVMKDGAVVPGAQGNNPGDRQGASMLRGVAQAGDPVKVLERIRAFSRQFEMPWLPDDPNAHALGRSQSHRSRRAKRQNGSVATLEELRACLD